MIEMASGTAVLGPTAMSVTGLTETEIGGAAGWTVPAGQNCIRGVRVQWAISLVPDALDHIPIYRLYSQDFAIEPCQFLGEPINGVTTSNNGACMRGSVYYPLNVKCSGGNVLHAYGMNAVTVTPVDVATVTIYFTNEGPRGPQYHYKLPTTLTPVATVVTAATANTSVNPITLIGGKMITAMYGVVWQTTHAVSVACVGKFKFTSPDLLVPYAPEFGNDGGNPFLSVGFTDSRLTKIGHDVIDDLDFGIPVNSTIATLTPVFTNGPLNIVGAFLMGVQYI
jgi:hypothetical protein